MTSNELGRLVLPTVRTTCQAVECGATFTEELGAYLHTDRETGKLIVFCEGCSTYVQLHNALRFPLVAL